MNLYETVIKCLNENKHTFEDIIRTQIPLSLCLISIYGYIKLNRHNLQLKNALMHCLQIKHQNIKKRKSEKYMALMTAIP